MRSNSSAVDRASVLSLSRRETEVLDRFARGDIDKEVAIRLGISLGTVRVYRRRIMKKLGTRNLVQAMLVAWRLGQFDMGAAADDAMAAREKPSLPPQAQDRVAQTLVALVSPRDRPTLEERALDPGCASA